MVGFMVSFMLIVPDKTADADHYFRSCDIILVIGAVVAGYLFSVVQHGFGSSTSEKIEASEDGKQESSTAGKPPLVVESLKEEPSAGWPSLGTLVADLLKLAVEGVGNLVLNIAPLHMQRVKRKTGLTPLKDRLVMPEDREENPVAQKLSSTPMITETLHAPSAANETVAKAQKSIKSSKFRDSTLSSKHRSTKRQEYAEFYGSTETPQASAKVPKDRLRHRHREKSGEVTYGTGHPEPKPSEMKAADYSDPKYDHYNMRSKYGADSGFSLLTVMPRVSFDVPSVLKAQGCCLWVTVSPYSPPARCGRNRSSGVIGGNHQSSVIVGA
uniref:Uncharacterized protein n=1 Tax=Aegilops tauschii TaxID=37682 RepID=M8AIZ6_AEGTA